MISEFSGAEHLLFKVVMVIAGLAHSLALLIAAIKWKPLLRWATRVNKVLDEDPVPEPEKPAPPKPTPPKPAVEELEVVETTLTDGGELHTLKSKSGKCFVVRL